jgi:hypothetical protein
MKTIKHRTINELRQVKDTNYQAPLSHDEAKDNRNKEEALHHLLRAHSILFENYENSAANQYVLSSISQIVDLLQPNSNEKG